VKALRNEFTELVYNPLKIVSHLNHSIHVIAFIFLVLPFFLAIPTLRAATIRLKWGLAFWARLFLPSAHRATKDHQ
jgi:uncharacterized membrane protein